MTQWKKRVKINPITLLPIFFCTDTPQPMLPPPPLSTTNKKEVPWQGRLCDIAGDELGIYKLHYKA